MIREFGAVENSHKEYDNLLYLRTLERKRNKKKKT